MYYNKENWVSIDERVDPEIKSARYQISSHGNVRSIFAISIPLYHSTNGYDYVMFECRDNKLKLFKLDLLVVKAFFPIKFNPDKHITVVHLNNDLRDNNICNLTPRETVEQWVDINEDRVKPGIYQISNLGRMRNVKHDKILKYQYLYGYSYISLLKPNSLKSTTFRVHRLVAKYFIQNPNNYSEVNHINGIKTYNVFDNLEWVSRSMNQKHAFDTCLQGNQISTEDLDNIRELIFSKNENALNIIHEKFPGLSQTVIDRIIKGESVYNRSYKYDLSKN